ncbi:MAG: FHA domain-containing protein [Muribaculaceae bacterium]|nr:FHA domain-containing protein [Muribaculaceae bacterium]
MEKKTVRCPNCNTNLAVRNPKNEASKVITCPKCGKKLRVKFNPQPIDDALPANGGGNETIMPNMNKPQPAPGPAPVAPPVPTPGPAAMANDTPAAPSPAGPPTPPPVPEKGIALVCNDVTYPLKPGRNHVGRQSKTKQVEVPLKISDLTVSRDNSIIDVFQRADGSYQALISNSNNQNTTYINGEPIRGEDRYVLNNGDKIVMGQTQIEFRNI